MATIPKRQRKLTIGGRKLIFLLLAALIYLVLYHIPPPPKTKNNTSSNRKAPEYDVDTTPRYLHLSSFREDPDSEYEKRISDALLEIERKALRERNWDTSAEDRIWQVLVDDKKASKFITEIFSGVPDLKKLYDSYPNHVIRSGLIRYLILWYYDGFYTDMDEDGPRSLNVSLVVGTEIDEPHASPRLMRGPRYKENTILEVTGPGVFTDAALDVLSQTLSPTHSLVESSVNADADIGDLVSSSTGVTQRRVMWAPFNRIKELVCVDASEAMDGKPMGGVCVLPVNVWGNGQRHSGAEGFRSKHACINHRFGRTWRKGWMEYFFG
ncbi:hypothetical protein ANOM_010087 [Aspergillus nomiae NRRL 13137]|uniref:Uncharacterized protein n=1 Tax=Aspergillus nomiae NRRL (strain ATCC 15546 / NRRL 13137 / CBS 260.88 / M93) TaxID=1509407 RepID=A0A0L1IT20_ASPN3|nr:uncharacterized protein ANOM_010087 [Aspergillus nomiae NRRL 13137]KNG82348.1 hypothetical protein ANOM_010087 [Aspergillus nomiae NRRL 13137]